MKIYKNKELLDVFGVKGKPISGVRIKKLGRIPDERGAIFHLLRRDEPFFNEFGEIYFSKINPGVIKGWHIHKQMSLNYAAIVGMVKLVLYDDRKSSSTKGNLLEIFMGEENCVLVNIPPLVWNGFKGIGLKASIVANCATMPHDPDEIERLSPFSKKIPYSWDLKHG